MFRPESLNYGRLHFLYGPLIVRGEKFLPKVGEEGRGVIIAFSIWTTVVQRRVFMVKLWGSTSCFDILSNPTREKNEEPFDTLLFFFFFFPSPLARHHPVAVRVVAAQKTFSLMIFSTHPIFPGPKPARAPHSLLMFKMFMIVRAGCENQVANLRLPAHHRRAEHTFSPTLTSKFPSLFMLVDFI